MNIIKFITLTVLSFYSHHTFAAESTYSALVTSKQCKEIHDQNISCLYTAGQTFELVIAGIGSPDAAILFKKSDFNGDYYGKYGVMHGCVIVHSAANVLNMAFISPKNGKVFQTWQECANGM